MFEDSWVDIFVSCLEVNRAPHIKLVVHDTGSGFILASLKDSKRNKLSGRGIMLIRELSDSLDYSVGGTKATVHFYL